LGQDGGRQEQGGEQEGEAHGRQETIRPSARRTTREP